MELNCKIPSDLDNLAKYNDQYSWIPGPNNIRPDNNTILLKDKFVEEINTFYHSISDYILNEIFGLDAIFNSEGKLKALISNNKDFRFIKNKFHINLLRKQIIILCGTHVYQN